MTLPPSLIKFATIILNSLKNLFNDNIIYFYKAKIRKSMIAQINYGERPNYYETAAIGEDEAIQIKGLIQLMNITNESIEVSSVQIEIGKKTFSKKLSLHLNDAPYTEVSNTLPPKTSRSIRLNYMIKTNSINKQELKSVKISVYDQYSNKRCKLKKVNVEPLSEYFSEYC